MSTRRFKVALVGCGQIADAHLQQIQRIPSAETVAVCDLEPLLARQAAERFDVPQQFTDLAEMLQTAAPDVLHITTPAHTHADIACAALRAGVPVYVEKPLAIDAAEARRILDTAETTGRLVCLGHDQLFDPAWKQCVALAESGVIGDVQHVESWLSYPLQGPFGRQVMSDTTHWVRRLPGGLFQNTISHPLYRITEFLRDPHPVVHAHWFSRDPDASLPTELRASIRGQSVTGSLTFISSTRPHRRITRVFGTAGSIEVDLDTQLCRIDRGEQVPGAFAKLEAPVRSLGTSLKHLLRNTSRFWQGDFHYFDGMCDLFQQFYSAIELGGTSPVPYGEALRVTSLMDAIFTDCVRNQQEYCYQSAPGQDALEEQSVLKLIDETRDLMATACGRSHLPSGRES